MEAQEPVQINAEMFHRWVAGMQQAGLAVEVEPPSTESLHKILTEPQGDL